MIRFRLLSSSSSRCSSSDLKKLFLEEPEFDEESNRLAGKIGNAPNIFNRLTSAFGDDMEMIEKFLVESRKELSAEAQARADMTLYLLYRKSSKPEKALDALVKAKPNIEETFGSASVELGSVIGYQGLAEAAQGNHEHATQLLLYASSLMKDVSPLASFRSRHIAACNLVESGRPDKAVSEFRMILRDIEKMSGKDSPCSAIAKTCVARAELLTGNTATASKLLQAAMHTLHLCLGHAHPTAHRTQRLWAVVEICDWEKDKKDLIQGLKDDLPNLTSKKD